MLTGRVAHLRRTKHAPAKKTKKNEKKPLPRDSRGSGCLWTVAKAVWYGSGRDKPAHLRENNRPNST